MKVMLDTNIFNLLMDGKFDPNGYEIYATHIQLDEIKKTKDTERRANLERIFHDASPEVEATSSFILGVSGLGQAALGDEHYWLNVRE